MSYRNQEEYLASLPVERQQQLVAIRQEVESCLPQAMRCISYNMPAWRDELIFLYVGMFKKHVGIYPPLAEDSASDPGLVAELAPYRNAKGNLAFPLNKPLPLALIGRVAQALYQQYQPKTASSC